MSSAFSEIVFMRILTVLFIIIFCMLKFVAAQTVVKEGSLYLHIDSKVSIQGAVINEGNIVNQGVLSVTGDWQNLSSYASSGGTIALTGSDTQVFFHNSQSVGILYIANSATVKLDSDVTVTHKLVLQEGVVIPGTGVKLIMAEEAAIEGGAPYAYIHGNIYHTGTGSKFYPVGKNGHYAPLTLTQVEGELPVVGVEFYDQTVQALEGHEMQLQNFYWSVSSLSGTFEGSPLTLDVSIENPSPNEEHWVVAGSEYLDESFIALDEVHVQRQADRFIFSSSKPINSKYITLGTSEGLVALIYIPNVLSPSAPNPEDRTIKVYSKNLAPDRFQWTIWDNWGQVVYTTISYEHASATGWQGTHQGKGEALPGIYKYFLQGTLTNGRSFSQKGNIILYK